MRPRLDEIIKKHVACSFATTDESKVCGACKHLLLAHDTPPCRYCYVSEEGLPMNPTMWEAEEHKKGGLQF